MEVVGEYIIRIFIASAVCSVLPSFLSETSSKGIIKIICGIFMTVTIISPILNIDFNYIANHLEQFDIYGSVAAAEQGVQDANLAQERLINERVTAYILDKAESLQMSIDVDLIMSDEPPLIPYSILIHGDYSPYSRKVLTAYLSEEIGIPEERQQWN